MPDFGLELHLGRLEGVRRGDVDVDLEDPAYMGVCACTQSREIVVGVKGGGRRVRLERPEGRTRPDSIPYHAFHTI